MRRPTHRAVQIHNTSKKLRGTINVNLIGFGTGDANRYIQKLLGDLQQLNEGRYNIVHFDPAKMDVKSIYRLPESDTILVFKDRIRIRKTILDERLKQFARDLTRALSAIRHIVKGRVIVIVAIPAKGLILNSLTAEGDLVIPWSEVFDETPVETDVDNDMVDREEEY